MSCVSPSATPGSTGSRQERSRTTTPHSASSRRTASCSTGLRARALLKIDGVWRDHVLFELLNE
jgi:hypothetical protein